MKCKKCGYEMVRKPEVRKIKFPANKTGEELIKDVSLVWWQCPSCGNRIVDPMSKTRFEVMLKSTGGVDITDAQ